MNSRDVFSHSVSVGRRQWRLAAIVYFVQLCLALTLGMQAHSVLEASIGNSLEINKLLAQYDHTVMTDFLKVHGASITPLIGQLRWLLLVWFIFSVFMNAGLLSAATNQEAGSSSARLFWQGGATYFFPFFKITLSFLLLAMAWTALVLLPIGLFLEPSLEYFSTEQYPVWATLFLLLVYLLGLVLLFVVSVQCKIAKIESAGPTAACIKTGWRSFWKNKRALLFFTFGFMALQVVLLAVYWLMESWIGMTSPGGILTLFALQQACLFFRIQIRQMVYAGYWVLSR